MRYNVRSMIDAFLLPVSHQKRHWKNINAITASPETRLLPCVSQSCAAGKVYGRPRIMGLSLVG